MFTAGLRRLRELVSIVLSGFDINNTPSGIHGHFVMD